MTSLLIWPWLPTWFLPSSHSFHNHSLSLKYFLFYPFSWPMTLVSISLKKKKNRNNSKNFHPLLPAHFISSCISPFIMDALSMNLSKANSSNIYLSTMHRDSIPAIVCFLFCFLKYFLHRAPLYLVDGSCLIHKSFKRANL